MTYIRLDNIVNIMKHIHNTYDINISKYQNHELIHDMYNIRCEMFDKYEKQLNLSDKYNFISVDVYKSMTAEIEDYINNTNLLSDEQKDDICRYIHLQRKSMLDACRYMHLQRKSMLDACSYIHLQRKSMLDALKKS